MKNAIIINGTVYELVPNDTVKDVCDTCDLYDHCSQLGLNICCDLHDAGDKEHYVKQKGGQP